MDRGASCSTRKWNFSQCHFTQHKSNLVFHRTRTSAIYARYCKNRLRYATGEGWNCYTLYVAMCEGLSSPPPMPPHVFVDFVVLPPGHGKSVTDFWVWDAHEAQLRCPDDVSGDIRRRSARRALKTKFYHLTQTMVTAGVLSFRENSHGRAGNRTWDLMISNQRLWPLDHEAGL